MRTVTDSETTLLQGAHFATFARVLVEDADGTYQDLTNQDSIDWVHSGRIAQTIDQIVATGAFTFWRKQEGGNSLAPLDEDSTLNRDAMAAYAPLIDVGRSIRCEFATVAIGSSPSGGDWQRVFQGVIDQWTVEDDFVQVMARDAIGAEIADRWIEAERTLGTGPGRAMEDVIQDILTEWTGLTLFTPTSPSFLITAYIQQRSTVMDALQQLAALAGWVVQPRWDDGTSSFRLTHPDRAPTSTTWTWEANRYEAVPDFTLSRLDIRNALSLRYTNTSDVQAQVTASDATSITKYDRQWMEIEEPKDSPIDTATEAQDMIDKALLDLKDPVANQEIKTLCFWPVQLNDYYLFGANDVHYTEDRSFGVTGFRHEFGGGQVDTFIRTRGVPAGFVKPWIQRAVTDPPVEEALTFRQASAQTARSVGDLWHDSDDGDRLYRWSGSAWVDVQDGDIGEALTDAAQGPFISLDPTQSGSTGSLDLTIKDPELKVTAIEFQNKAGSGDYGGSWLSTWDRSTGTIGASTTLTRGEDVGLLGKHNASIKIRVTYDNSQGASQTWGHAHTFDADHVAEITGIQIAVTSDGNILVSAQGDEDTNNMYVTASDGGTPSDPTVATNDGVITGRTGTVDTSISATVGNVITVKVVGANSAAALGGVRSGQLLKVTDRPPEIFVKEVRSTGTSTITIDVEDPELVVTAVEYKQRAGIEGGDTLDSTWRTNWTSSTGTPGTNVTLQRVFDVPVDPGLEGELQWRVQFTDVDGTTQTIGNSFKVVNLEEEEGSVVVPFTAVQLELTTNNGFYNRSSGYLHNSGTAAPTNYSGTIVMPPNVKMTSAELVGYRNGTSDVCRVIIKKIANTSSSTATSLVTITHDTTGWQAKSGTLSETVDEDTTYFFELLLDPVATPTFARFRSLKVIYGRPAYRYSY